MKGVVTLLALAFTPLLLAAAPHPKILLEATNTIEGFHWRDQTLFLRLFSDGRIQWEEQTSKAKVLRTAKIEAPEMAAFVDSARKAASELPAKLGPYNTYTDTVVYFRIRISTPGLDKSIKVVNPWLCTLPSCSLGKKSPMPVALSTLLCEIETMHNRVAQDKQHLACPNGGDQKSQ